MHVLGWEPVASLWPSVINRNYYCFFLLFIFRLVRFSLVFCSFFFLLFCNRVSQAGIFGEFRDASRRVNKYIRARGIHKHIIVTPHAQNLISLSSRVTAGCRPFCLAYPSKCILGLFFRYLLFPICFFPLFFQIPRRFSCPRSPGEIQLLELSRNPDPIESG